MGIDQIIEETMQRCYEESLHDDLLNSFRIKAWDKFLELSSSSRKKAPFAKDLQKLFQNDLNLVLQKEEEKKAILPYLHPECHSSYIVFVNGHLDISLSNISAFSDAELLSLEEAMDSFGIFLQSRLLQRITQEKDPFAILNTAIYSKGAFFYLPSGQKAKAPLQILHIIDEGNGYYCPRLQVALAEETSLKLFNTYIMRKPMNKRGFFYNYMMDVSLDKKADLSISSHFANSTDGFIFETLRGDLKKRANLHTLSFLKGKNLYQNYQVDLLEKFSSVSLQGLSYLKGQDLCKVDICVNHKAEECFSDQLFKSVLFDEANYSFTGKIFVEPIAQKTEAYQLSQNLLLSDTAVCQSRPNLEIFADDVKASHGMTAADLSEEQFFYLASRGLDRNQAKKLLIEAFCKKILEQCGIASLKKKMLDEL